MSVLCYSAAVDAFKHLLAACFRNAASEPVREWLRALSRDDRKLIGSDIKAIQLGWPIGMSTYRLLSGGLYEVQSDLTNRTARLLFFISDGQLILLHGFINQDQRTPESELRLAHERMGMFLSRVTQGRGTRTTAEDGP